MSEKIKRAYGWQPGLPDKRDFKYREVHRQEVSIPAVVNLQQFCPAVYDQGDLGSCTANAIGGLVEFLLKKEGHSPYTPSRLFIYYNERSIEGDVSQDNGAQISDGMQVVQTIGAPHESLWWYNTKKFAEKPTKNVFDDAAKHKLGTYSKLDNTKLDDLQNCLASGYPFVFGFTVFESFESDSVAKSGFLSMPGKNEKELGGHAVLCVGYDRIKQAFLVRNSWGADWGLKGYFWIPFQYLLNTDLASDLWTARLAN